MRLPGSPKQTKMENSMLTKTIWFQLPGSIKTLIFSPQGAPWQPGAPGSLPQTISKGVPFLGQMNKLSGCFFERNNHPISSVFKPSPEAWLLLPNHFLCFRDFVFSCFRVFVFSCFRDFVYSRFRVFVFSRFRVFVFS